MYMFFLYALWATPRILLLGEETQRLQNEGSFFHIEHQDCNVPQQLLWSSLGVGALGDDGLF